LFKLSHFIIAFSLLLAGCDKPSEAPIPKSPVPAVNNDKVITFVTINSPNTYFVDGNNEFAGLEYDLAKLFVQELDDGTQLKFIVEKHIDQVLPNLMNGKADIAAADITVTDARKKHIDFSKPYQDVQQQVVYNKVYTKIPPKNLKELIGKNISVPAGTSFAERLAKLHQLEPNLFWEERRDVDSEKIIQEVVNGEADFTIADSHLVAILQNYYPNLGVAFSIGEPEKIAWGISKQADPMLVEKANAFFTKIKNDGTLRNLIDRYHGNAKRLKPLDIKTFLMNSNTLLPKYKYLFKQAQEITGIDWRLLAAISYQESHWDTFNAYQRARLNDADRSHCRPNGRHR
jgi:membrane-bound lytic murein transglycosylase F